MLNALLATTCFCSVAGCLVQVFILVNPPHHGPRTTMVQDLGKLLGYAFLVFFFGYLAFVA